MKKNKRVKDLSVKVEKVLKEQEQFKEVKDQYQLNRYYPWEEE
jgi:hypothetical protein